MSLETINRTALANQAFSGSVLLAEIPGQVKIEQAWGRCGERPMRPSIIFDIASISKLFTTTAILRLATKKELNLNDRIAEHLDHSLDRTLRLALDRRLGSADLRAALSHSTGFHYWYPFYTRRGEGFETILESILGDYPTDGKTVYSDLNFMILGKIIEAVTALPLDRAMADLVFKPLCLSHTSYGPPLGQTAPTEWGNRIEHSMVKALNLNFDHWRDDKVAMSGTCNDGNGHYFFGGIAGHAGIFSNARDLCILGRLYLEDGQLADGTPYLDPELTKEACTDRGTGRGLGFQFGKNYPDSGFGHTGFTGTYLYLNKERDLVAAILTNRLNSITPRTIIDYHLELMHEIL